MSHGRMLIKNIGTLLSMAGGADHGIIYDAAVVIADGLVVWSGPEAELDRSIIADAVVIDAGGRLVSPGLVECHTHLVFAGQRADEYEARATGVSYETIARRGGGILNTVNAVRNSSVSELYNLALSRAMSFLTSGVTTLEIKSGYGLSLEHEIKILEVISLLGQRTCLDIVPTFLGAHAYPPEAAGDRQAHVESIINQWIPEVARRRLALFCDVFCEKVAFSVEDSERILVAASRHGMKLKVHAEQLSASGAAALAARLGAVSADHLDHATDADIDAMVAAGVVGVLLPGCPVSLCNHAYPSARRYIDRGLKIALSTDFNPGSSVTGNLCLMGTFGMSFMGMSAIEAWRGITVNAAAAVGLPPTYGTLVPGAPADLVMWHCSDFREPFYNYGGNHVAMVLKAGLPVVERSSSGEVTILA